jgi:hypothetical protein
MFLGGYLFSLAGIKQAMATGIIMMGIPSLINKKYLKFYLCCIVAVGFHTYSFIYMILPLLGKEVFNKRTALFIAIVLTVGVGMSYFSEVISAIIKLLEHNVEDEIVFTGSVNVLRAVVFTIPFILALFAKDTICETCSDGEKWFLKISILSSVFMILALFGNPILFGRIPQYFNVGMVISIPIIIKLVFVEKDATLITIIAMACYFAFGIYALYGDGAFSEDIFRLVKIFVQV